MTVNCLGLEPLRFASPFAVDQLSLYQTLFLEKRNWSLEISLRAIPVGPNYYHFRISRIGLSSLLVSHPFLWFRTCKTHSYQVWLWNGALATWL